MHMDVFIYVCVYRGGGEVPAALLVTAPAPSRLPVFGIVCVKVSKEHQDKRKIGAFLAFVTVKLFETDAEKGGRQKKRR